MLKPNEDGNGKFTELFLPEEKPHEGKLFPGPRELPADLMPLAMQIIEQAKARTESDFTVKALGRGFRVHRMPTSDGRVLICRQIPTSIWSLGDVGMPKFIEQSLLSPRLNYGGLILIAGKPGSGKSVSTAAVIKARLETFGGICITVEDPVEMPLQGSHGNGFCLQRGVVGQEAFAGAVRDAMRAYPTQVNSILMIGEVRDPETAVLALQASVDGRLVITTIHGGDPIHAIYRLLSLASHAVGAREARELMAAGFRVVLHQRLKKNILGVQFLLDTVSAASTIRSKDQSLELLRNEMAQQRNLLKKSYPIPVRRDQR